MRRSTLVVAPTLDLVRQWYDLLRATFGVAVGVVGGGDHDVQPITVTTYDSAYLHMEHLGGRFGLVVSNPPYVPAATAALPRHGKARCWDAGPDGRALLDRICAAVPDVLAPDGTVLLVHSSVCDAAVTVAALHHAGLAARELARITVPFGPVMHARARMLEARGLVAHGQRSEELVVVEGRYDDEPRP